MPIIFGYNATTGVTEYWGYDPQTGRAYVRSERDSEPFLRATAEARNTGSADANPIFKKEKEMHCYATLDPIVMLELRAKGIDIHSKDPAMQRRMFQEINENYPYCKVTTRVHRG